MENDLDQPVDLQVDASQMVEQWAAYVIERWHFALQTAKVGEETHEYTHGNRKMKIKGVRNGPLWDSFVKELVKADGDVNTVIFKFNKYGRFVDMGVGRGLTLNERLTSLKHDRYRNTEGKITGGPSRKPKRWYTKTFYSQVAKLGDLFKQQYGDQVVKIIESSLRSEITINQG